MDWDIGLILAQDGIAGGAIYALVALSLVLMFAVTRVIFIPSGEFAAYGALTYAALDAGAVPGVVWLAGVLGGVAFVVGLWRDRRVSLGLVVETLVLPATGIGLAVWLAPGRPAPLVSAVLALVLVTPLAPAIYRIAYQKLAEASVLVLLIASVGVHLAMLGTGLLLFGAEGSRARPFSEGNFSWGPLMVPAQTLWVFAVALVLIAALFGFFGFTLAGKALRATSVNRLGARLVGIETALSGRIAFALAGFIAATAGVLIAPLTTVFYDSGFLIGLKGFVAAIVGGLGSYPAAAVAAIGVGLVESFSSFWASAFKEVIVFTALIPVLLWRSLATHEVDEE